MDTCNCSGGGEGEGGGRNVQIGHGGTWLWRSSTVMISLLTSLSLFQMLACLHLVNLIWAGRGSTTPRTYSISRLEAAGPPLPIVPPHLNPAPHPAVPPIGSHTFARAHLGMIEKSASRDREILQRELSALHHRTNCCTFPLERKKHHNGKLGFAGIAERTRRRETISCPFAGILSAFS